MKIASIKLIFLINRNDELQLLFVSSGCQSLPESGMSLIVSYFVILFISHICLFDDLFVCYFYYSNLSVEIHSQWRLPQMAYLPQTRKWAPYFEFWCDKTMYFKTCRGPETQLRHTIHCLISSNSGSSSVYTFWWKSTKLFDRQLSKSRCKHLSSFPGLDSQNIFVQIFQIYLLKLLDTFCQITIVFMRRRLSKSPSKHLSSFPESDSHVIDVLGWDLILT